MRTKLYRLSIALLLANIDKIHTDESTQIKRDPIVQTRYGQVRGFTLVYTSPTKYIKKTSFAFQGIPYAEPPTGDLRFEPPVQKKPWTETLNATKEGPLCAQFYQNFRGSEDCLFLNIYTPSLNKKRPVMVYIYGGEFMFGNSSYKYQSPELLLDQDIVFVSINFRQGLLGFLSTGDLVAPGNAGLKDQILALKWIQENIIHFGGDPSAVTIFGQSSGAACVSYMLLSPMSKGLFRGAIMQSGSSLSLRTKSRILKTLAMELGKQLHLDTRNSESLVKGLKRVDAAKLVSAAYAINLRIYQENPLTGLPIAPVIETDYPQAFLIDKSYELFKNGSYVQVPTIIGFNSNESIGLVGTPFDAPMHFFEQFRDDQGNVSLLTPADLTENKTKEQIVGQLIKDRYFGATEKIYNFFNDDQFIRPERKQALLTSKYSPVYFYRFNYIGKLPGIEKRPGHGVGLGEETSYIFYKKINNLSKDDEITRNRMVKLWTNFAKYGNPTPLEDRSLNIVWPKVSSSGGLRYLDITNKLKIKFNPARSSMKFYEDIYNTYGDPPYKTY